MQTRERLATLGKRFYCICFAIRSGSSLLCDDLSQWRVGAPTEYFQFPNPALENVRLADYVVDLAAGAPGDYFGFKIAWDQAYDLVKQLRQEGDESVRFDLRTIFPDLKYIHIVRQDKLGQAISAWRAEDSGTWHWRQGTSPVRGCPSYNFEGVQWHLQKVLADDWLWKSHFQEYGIQPFTVDYEDYIQDRVGQLSHIVEFLGGSYTTSPLEERLRVMRDDWTSQTSTKFRTDLYAYPDPLLVRSRRAVPPELEGIPTGADETHPVISPDPRSPSPFRLLPPLGAPVAVALGVSAIDAALPQVTLAPLLVAAPLLAGFLASPVTIAIVTVLAAILMLPVGFADRIADSAAQFGIIAAILLVGGIALWIAQRRSGRRAEG
jgi:LPS sulfotransferase NodH